MSVLLDPKLKDKDVTVVLLTEEEKQRIATQLKNTEIQLSFVFEEDVPSNLQILTN